jgi:hypothetical protein
VRTQFGGEYQSLFRRFSTQNLGEAAVDIPNGI